MKHSRILLCLTLATTLLASCRKDLDYKLGGIEPQLNMNAQLKVGDTLHIVHLCFSTDKTLRPVQSAAVRCLVNGKLVATAAEVDGNKYRTPLVNSHSWPGYSFSPKDMLQKSFGFKADFKEGDKVRIEADADGRKAYSEILVPKTPDFEIADTTASYDPNETYEWKGEKYYKQTLKLHLRGRDNVQGSNYYRLWGILKSDDLIYLGGQHAETPSDPGTEPQEEPGEVKTERIQYENGILLRWKNDPILNDGAPAEDLDLFGASQNIYNAFSDNLFSDRPFDLNVQVYRSELRHINDQIFRDREQDAVDSVLAKNTLVVCLSAVSEAEYHLLKALNIRANGSDEGQFFTEPITFPDNVEGGIGLVSIETPLKRCLELPPFVQRLELYAETD